ncbi:hypothetical protein QAD02_022101 [Eretmocerus hayati]|uniref:Uncharacterized protein n=1 Tax=Eretmocerus hayati TaxID=131215 RepID=A0ACC2PVB6_9HYME|nr:hypothetical protein QAD02_022101 [Eretmocerus hayati]
MIDLPNDLRVNNYSLILPSVAVGNVGQLSIDLLISSLELKRIGRVFDPVFIPLVGINPYNQNSDDICTAVDVYVSHEKKLVVLQIRSPIVQRPTNFFQQILTFVTDHNINRVIILTSSFGHEKRDEQLRTAPFRYLATNTISAEFCNFFNDLSWIALEPKIVDGFSGQSEIRINGGGFAKLLFDMLQNNKIPCLILLKFCSEGDNVPDAVELVNYLNQWLKLLSVNSRNECILKYPPSWKFLFGNSAPRGIY